MSSPADFQKHEKSPKICLKTPVKSSCIFNANFNDFCFCFGSQNPSQKWIALDLFFDIFPKTYPRWSQDAPRRLQDSSKTPPGASKTAPRAPKSSEDAPKSLQDASKSPQEPPTEGHRGLQVLIRSPLQNKVRQTTRSQDWLVDRACLTLRSASQRHRPPLHVD